MAAIIRAVIWDLDGVIIDSAEEHRQSWHILAHDEGLPLTDEQFWATFGMRNDAIIPLLWGEMPADRVKQLADKKEAYFRELIQKTAHPLPGSIELMSGLHDAGYLQALASSAPMQNIEVISHSLGLQRYLTQLVSGENVPHGKPAPDVFLKAAELLAINPTACLVIEDAVAGVQAAHVAGMRCLSVAYDRDLPGLRAAELMVHDLTQVSVHTIQNLS
jgi:beta-phosphoglucomutase